MGGSVPFLKFIFANGGLAGTIEDIHIYIYVDGGLRWPCKSWGYQQDVAHSLILPSQEPSR